MSLDTLTRAEPSLLGGRPTDPALVTDLEVVTYADLAAAVTAEAERLGPQRRVAVVEMRNDVRSVVRLLGALEARHPVVLLGPDDGDRHDEIRRRYAGALDLHPELALLLSTSGSTGSPKLVRLSRDNLLANAHSIADYLRLTAADRAITSLPLHYCYGLSVLTSHLVSGASVVLTDLSVTDGCFWELAQRTRTTSFAGVPYTFDLLESSGFADRELPDLRYVTQAGGRMHPDQVRRFADLGRRRGFDLFVMYGQTEATARMAYLPPHLAASRPDAIGVPVPGGDFRLEPVAGDLADGVGELVYTGPNVMMGYAERAADLARGPDLGELRTGDLARRSPDGLWELHGRLDRHAKLFGLRVDLDRAEGLLGSPAAVVAVGDALHVFVDRPRARRSVGSRLAAAAGLPPGAVRVHVVDALPTTDRGKTDYAALRAQAESVTRLENDTDADTAGGVGPGSATPAALRDLYAVALGRPDATVHDSFVDLGGDSLSFVELSVQLGTRLGHLPAGWQHLSPQRLATTRRPAAGRPRWWSPVETSVLLRAAAITLIVVSHTDLWIVMGGAHVLLALVGFSLARFTLPVVGRVARSRRLVATTAGIAVPASLWILVAGRLSGDYEVTTAFYLNQLLGAETWSRDWHFWFLEVLVWSYLAVALLLRLPLVDRWQRRAPFGTAVTVVVAALAVRYAVTGVGADGIEEYTLPVAFWCLAVGWAAGEARTRTQRVVVAVLVLAGVAGFFPDEGSRQLVLLVGMLMLLLPWAVPVPRWSAPLVQRLAHASLWIYLTHWQVYPGLEAAGLQVLAVVASVTVGLLALRLQAPLLAWVQRCVRRGSPLPAC